MEHIRFSLTGYVYIQVYRYVVSIGHSTVYTRVLRVPTVTRYVKGARVNRLQQTSLK